MVVDDSAFIRRRIVQILSQDPALNVVGTADNGLQAVSMAETLKPDVITMDIEMPVMDGITAVRKIMEKTPCPILMFSASTKAGAKATLEALNAGAVDFLPKELDQINCDRLVAEMSLCESVRKLGQKNSAKSSSRFDESRLPVSKAELPLSSTGKRKTKKAPKLIVLAASTGGPVAIQKVLSELPQGFGMPVLVVQHMPANFTPSFAERLDKLCNVQVKEAEDGDLLKPGEVLLAPGGRQLLLKKRGPKLSVTLRDSIQTETYQPCVDTTLSSIASELSEPVLTVIMTGMGSDGRIGAEKLKKSGSTIWGQDENSCTVYGMPKAVAEAGLVDTVLPLDEIGSALVNING